MKKLILLFATLALALGSKAEDYPIKIAGEVVTSDNYTSITAANGFDAVKSGELTYDPATRTLTLWDAVIEAVQLNAIEITSTGSEVYHIVIPEGTTSSSYSPISAGLKTTAPTIISGGGKVTFSSGDDCGIYAHYYSTAVDYTLRITGGTTVTATGRYGVSGYSKNYGTLAVDTATLRATGNGVGSICDLKNLSLSGVEIASPSGAEWNATKGGVCLSGETTLIKTEVLIGKPLEQYMLYIAGERVTNYNCDDLSYLGSWGNMSYDPATKTLTLNDVTLETSQYFPIASYADSLTIVLLGNNYVTATGSDLEALRLRNTMLTVITGGGYLQANSNYSYALHVSERLEVTGGVDLFLNGEDTGSVGLAGFSSGCNIVISDDRTKVRARGNKHPVENILSLTLENGLQIVYPEGGTFDASQMTVVKNGSPLTLEEVRIENPVDVEVGYAELDATRYDVDGSGDLTAEDLELMANALVGKVNYPATGLTLSDTELSVPQHGSYQLTATVEPSTSDYKALSWSTTNKNIARVNGGLVVGYAPGTCTITATTMDGSNLTVSCQVTVFDITTYEDANGCVDLGLPSGTLWASKNLGATEIHELGDWYAQGETSTKTCFLDSNYTYNPNGATEVAEADDAAYVNLGPNWRTPSAGQFGELFSTSNTTIKRVSLHSQKGILITSKANGKSIFLPNTGTLTNTDYIQNTNYSWLHTRTVNYYVFDTSVQGLNSAMMKLGLKIRPVWQGNQ